MVNGLAYRRQRRVLSVFRVADCAGGSCTPAWTGLTSGGIFNTPAVAGGLVLVGSTDHFVYAFPAQGCGAPTCPPRWRGRMVDAPLYSSIAVAGGLAYIGDAGGRLYAFPVKGCGRATCAPTGSGSRCERAADQRARGGGGWRYVSSWYAPTWSPGACWRSCVGLCGGMPARMDAACSARATPQAPLVSGGVVFASSSTQFGRPGHQVHTASRPTDAVLPSAGRCAPTVRRRRWPAGWRCPRTLFAACRPARPKHVEVVAAYPVAGCGNGPPARRGGPA